MNEMPPEQQKELLRSQQFFIGLGIGLIPLVLALISVGLMRSSTNGTLLTLALILYSLELIASIILLVRERLRFIGYALLTMFLITPVIYFIACIVQISKP